MPKLIDLTGKIFDKLIVLEKAPSRARLYIGNVSVAIIKMYQLIC